MAALGNYGRLLNETGGLGWERVIHHKVLPSSGDISAQVWRPSGSDPICQWGKELQAEKTHAVVAHIIARKKTKQNKIKHKTKQKGLLGS